MFCPICRDWKNKALWLPSQYTNQSPDWNARDRCKDCWAKGPDSEAMAWMQTDDWLHNYIEENRRQDHIDVYLAFHADADLKQGKKWSHYGALKYRQPRDQRQWTDHTGDWFDPGNSNYKEAVQEVDNTNRIANQTGLTDAEHVADIVEGLIGLKIAVETGKGPESIHATSYCLYPKIALTLHEIAAFWSTVAYTVYHRNIVKEWIQSTQARICLATEQTLAAISVQRQSASARDSLRAPEKRRRKDVEIDEILRCDLFNMVANLMSCLYSKASNALH